MPPYIGQMSTTPWPESENLTDAEVRALAAQDQEDMRFRAIDALTGFRRLRPPPPGPAGVREPARPRTPPDSLSASIDLPVEGESA